MNKSVTPLLLAGTLSLSACSTTPTNARIGATTGAGAGAVAGHEFGKRIQ